MNRKRAKTHKLKKSLYFVVKISIKGILLYYQHQQQPTASPEKNQTKKRVKCKQSSKDTFTVTDI